MECGCKQNVTNNIKIEGDMGGDPIWCSRCSWNLDIDEAPISDELKVELEEWMANYGSWIDWDKDKLLPNGTRLEEEHNTQGMKLTEKVEKELIERYKVKFSPSTSAQEYASFKDE